MALLIKEVARKRVANKINKTAFSFKTGLLYNGCGATSTDTGVFQRFNKKIVLLMKESKIFISLTLYYPQNVSSY